MNPKSRPEIAIPLRSDAIRFAKAAAEKSGYDFRLLDPHSGYLCRISSRTGTVLLGGGSVSSWPLNLAAAATLATDKYFANLALQDCGIATPAGETVFLSERYRDLREPGRELDDLPALCSSFVWPLVAKPNNGSRGAYVQLCHDLAELRAHLERMRERYDIALIQQFMQGDEYRVFVFQDEAVFSYKKRREALTADGANSIAALVQAESRRLIGKGLDAIALDSKVFRESLRALNLTLDSIPPEGTRIEVGIRANLSAGGTPENFTIEPPPRLAEIARAATRCLGLTVAGVDVILPFGSNDTAPVILEINSNPSIGSLERVGRVDIAVSLYERVLRLLLGGHESR